MNKKKILILVVIVSLTAITSIIPGVTIIPKAAAAGGPDFNLLIGGGSQGHQPSPADVGQSATATVQLNGTIQTPTVSMSISNISPASGLTCGSVTPPTLSPGSVASVTCTATVRGTYQVTVSATNTTVTRNAIWTFWIQEFFLSPNSPAPVDAGIDATGTVTLTRLGVYPFNDTVTLSDLPLPAGLTCGGLTPSSLPPGPKTGQTSSVLCHASTAGNYPLTITGSFTNSTDSYSNSTLITFRVRQFLVTATTPALIIAGRSTTSTITVNFLNGFSGTVTLTSLPGDSNLSCGSFSPSNTVTGNSTLTLTCSASVLGAHGLTVVGTSGVQSFSASTTITVIGLVCMVAPQDLAPAPGKCPSTPDIYNGPITTPNTLLGVPILANNTDGMNGFDITVNSSDVSVLKPYGVDLSGSVLTSPIILLECIGRTLVSTGGTCQNSDTASTIHLAVTSQGGLTPSPTNGLLFTAIFNITGTTSPGGIAVRFQTGCVTSTVSGTTNNECVTIANGIVGGVPVETQTATFDNSDTTSLGYVTATSTASSVGPFVPGSNNVGSTSITLTPNNGLGIGNPNDPLVTLTATVGGVGNKPTVSLSTTGVDLTSGPQTFTVTFTVGQFVTARNYNVTILSSYTSTNEADFTTQYSLSIPIQLTVRIVDYTLAASPSPVITPLGVATTATTTISVNALNGFGGTVKLAKPSLSASAVSAGITANYDVFTLTGSQTATLTINTLTATPAGSYTVTLNSNTTVSGTLRTRSLTLTVTVQLQGFTISASPTSVSALPSAAGTSTITVTGSGGLTGSISLTETISPSSGLTCTLTPTSVTLSSTTTTATSTLSCSGSIGTYTVTVTGTFTGLAPKTVDVTYTIAQPDFTVTATNNVAALVGSPATATVTLTSIAGYKGSIDLTRNDTINCVGGFSTTPIVLGSSGQSILTCTFSTAGTYFVTVTGTNATTSLSHTATITFTVTVFSPQHSVSVTSTFTSRTDTVGATLTITATVHNTGNLDETVTVYLRADNSTVVTVSNVSVPAGTTKDVTLVWDTTGYSAQQYNLSVYVALPSGETNSASSTTSLGAYTLNAASAPFGILDPMTLAAITAVVVVGAAAIIVLLRRRRPKSTETLS